MSKRKYPRALIFILSIAIILRLIKLNKNLYIDESYSLFFSQHNLSEIWMMSLHDVHPPGYSYFLHFWQLISNNIIFLRMTSVILGVLTVYMVYLIGKQLFNKRVGLLAALFLAVNPLHIQMAQQIRMYVVITFLLSSAFYMLFENRWVLYALLCSLSVWMGYLAVLPVATLMIYSLIKNKFSKESIAANSLLVLLVTPTLYLVLISMGSQSLGSHSSPYWVFFILPYIFSTFLVGYINPYFINFSPIMGFSLVGLILLLMSFLYLLYGFIKQKDGLFSLSLLILSPILFLFFLDPILSIQLEAKRFMFSLVLLSILLAKGAYNIKGGRLVFLLILILSTPPIYSFYNYDYTDWKGATEHIMQNETNGDVILVAKSSIKMPIDIYYKGSSKVYALPHKINFSENWIGKDVINETNVKVISNLSRHHYRVWYVENRVKNAISPPDIVISYLGKEYKLEHIESFSNGDLKVYLFKK